MYNERSVRSRSSRSPRNRKRFHVRGTNNQARTISACSQIDEKKERMLKLFADKLDVSFDEFEREAKAYSAPKPSHTCQTSPAVIIINANADKCLKAWVDYVWKEGGGFGVPKELRAETKENGQGHIRTPGYGLFELILEVDAQARLIEYTIPRGLPVTSHHASVYFEQLDDGTTRVAWIVRYTPKWYGGILGYHCERILFPQFLRNLKTEVESGRGPR